MVAALHLALHGGLHTFPMYVGGSSFGGASGCSFHLAQMVSTLLMWRFTYLARYGLLLVASPSVPSLASGDGSHSSCLDEVPLLASGGSHTYAYVCLLHHLVPDVPSSAGDVLLHTLCQVLSILF